MIDLDGDSLQVVGQAKHRGSLKTARLDHPAKTQWEEPRDLGCSTDLDVTKIVCGKASVGEISCAVETSSPYLYFAWIGKSMTACVPNLKLSQTAIQDIAATEEFLVATMRSTESASKECYIGIWPFHHNQHIEFVKSVNTFTCPARSAGSLSISILYGTDSRAEAIIGGDSPQSFQLSALSLRIPQGINDLSGLDLEFTNMYPGTFKPEPLNVVSLISQPDPKAKPDDPKKTNWMRTFLIILAIIIVIGSGVGLFIYYKKSKGTEDEDINYAGASYVKAD